DFEWAILIEEEKPEYKEYFRNLTQLLHIKVLNLGETILPSVVIESLNSAYSNQPKDNWFYDSITQRGFAFDGYMPDACKTPLGKTATSGLQDGEIGPDGKKVYELIRTPERMAQLQNEEWYQDDPLLPNCMLTYRLIAGDESLARNYKIEITRQLQKITSGTPTLISQTRAITLLTRNLTRHYLSINEPNQEGKLYDVKKEIYRLPDRIIDGLAFYYSLNSISSWERLEELCKLGIITKEANNHLKVAMSIATELRLRTYLALDKQGETMTGNTILFDKLEAKEAITLDLIQEAFKIPYQAMLFRFYYTIIPLQNLLLESLSIAQQKNEQLRELLPKKHSLLDISDKMKGIIYNRLLQSKTAKYHFERALEQDPKNPNILDYLGSINLSLGEYQSAKKYFEQALSLIQPNNSINLTTIYVNLSNVYWRLGEYQQHIDLLHKALIIREKVLGRQHPDIAAILNNLGTAYGDLGEYQTEIKLLKEALQIYKDTFGNQHHTIATLLNNLGVAY
ncbi:MAG: tetratricopeptide repeat protein, partial [Burkholderiales bacterium]